MTEVDIELMKKAIDLAEQCRPIADRIPMVGAVIAVGDTVVGRGHRGTGKTGDDDHAEMVALKGVVERRQLSHATVYTTLEPCTPEVRSDPLNCCTELIRQAEVRKVFIGILDPNQGVRGKGLWELQSRGIEVELFPPDLAKRIRILNDKFIRIQQTLGIKITNVEPGQTIRTYDKGGVYQIEGTFLNPPGEDVFAITSIAGRWWPQPYSLRVTGDHRWAVNVHFGAYGQHGIYIVRASELGIDLIKYYRKICGIAVKRRNDVREYVNAVKPAGEHNLFQLLGADYPSIEMARVPKGLELLAMVEVTVESPPASG